MSNTAAELEVLVRSNTSEAESGLSGLSNRLNSLNSTQLSAASAGFLGLGTAIAGAFVGAIGIASSFEAQLSAIASVGGAEAQARMQEITATALELGSTTAFSASEAAAGMEELIKAGMPIEEVLNGGAQAALDLAAATGTAVPDAAQLISNTMNQMGVDAETAANVITQVTNAAAMDVSDFAYSFKTAGTAAAALGVPIEDLAAVFGVLSNQGIKGEQAGTAVRNMLLGLSNPSDEAKAALDSLGVTVFDSQGNFVGMEAVMGDLNKAFKTMTPQQKLATAEMIVGKDAAAAFLVLVEGGPGALNAMSDAMANTGTASDQAAARTDNVRGAMDTMMGSLETIAIIIGMRLLPAVQSFLDFLTMLLNGFLNLSPELQNAILIFAGVAAVLSIVAGAFIAAQIAAALFGATFWAALAPIIAVVAAVALLAAGLYYAYSTNLLGFRDGVQWVIDKLGEFWQTLQNAWSIVTSLDWSGTWQALVDATAQGWAIIQSTISTVLNVLLGVISAVWSGIVAIVTTWIEIHKTIIATAFNAIQSVILTALSIILAVVAAVWSGLQVVVSTAVAAIQTAISTAWTTIQTEAGTVWSTVLAVISTTLNTLLGLMSAIWSGIRTVVTSAVEGLKSSVIAAFSSLLSAATAQAAAIKTNVVNAFTSLASSAISTAQNLSSSVISAIATLLSGLIAQMSAIKANVLSAFQSAYDTATSKAASIASDVISALSGLASTLYSSMFSAGWNVGQGLIDGISNIWESVVSYASSLGDAVKGVIKGALDVFSPSRATIWMGEMVGKGLVVGMAASMPAVKQQSFELAAAALPQMPTPHAMPAPAASSRGTTVVNQTFNVTLSVSEFEELTEAIEFAQGLASSSQRELILAA